MAATRIVEEERGTFAGTRRSSHQGYYAGDFRRNASTYDGFARAARFADPTAGSGWSGSTFGPTR